MKKIAICCAVAAIACGALFGTAVGEDKKPAMPTAEEMAAMAPKPTKEHGYIKDMVGEWDVDVESTFMGQTEKSKATESTKMFGDFWLISEFKGTMMGAPMEGRSMIGYDPNRGKVIQTWIDSMSPMIGIYEGEFSADGKVLTGSAKEKGMDGQPVVTSLKTTKIDDDNHVFEMQQANEKGDVLWTMKMKYTRKR